MLDFFSLIVSYAIIVAGGCVMIALVWFVAIWIVTNCAEYSWMNRENWHFVQHAFLSWWCHRDLLRYLEDRKGKFHTRIAKGRERAADFKIESFVRHYDFSTIKPELLALPNGMILHPVHGLLCIATVVYVDGVKNMKLVFTPIQFATQDDAKDWFGPDGTNTMLDKLFVGLSDVNSKLTLSHLTVDPITST